MTFLYNQLIDPKDQIAYENELSVHSNAIKKSAEFLIRSLQLMQSAIRNDSLVHSVLFLLGRHVAEQVDAASVLVAQGCATPCKSHLRSAFEADISSRFIMESDSERRAIAYYVKHAHDRIRLYDKLDPTSAAGKLMRKEIESDEIVSDIIGNLPPYDYESKKEKFKNLLLRAPFAEVNEEWCYQK